MSNRKPAYVIGIILPAIILSLPQLFSAVAMLREFPRMPMLQSMWSQSFVRFDYSPISHSPFWQDHFIEFSRHDRGERGGFIPVFLMHDPETGASHRSEIRVEGDSHGQRPVVYGNQFWWMLETPMSFQVIDQSVRQVAIRRPFQWVADNQRFLLNGIPAEVNHNRGGFGFAVTSMLANAWTVTHQVVLPEPRRTWMFGKTAVSFQTTSAIACLNQGDRIHCFVRASDRLLYREGLVLNPITNSPAGAVEEPASALQPANADLEVTGWSLVRAAPMSGVALTHCGLLIEGRPAALIVDDLSTGTPSGQIYRFDGSTWTLFETVKFPFGSNQFRAVCREDGQRSYIVVTTSTGRAHVYAVSSSGVKQTLIDPPQSQAGAYRLRHFLVFPFGALVLGTIQGLFTWMLMKQFTSDDYGFGHQTVQLASLGRRGLARIIDLAIILASTLALAGILLLGFDWSALSEAMNLQVDHPTVHIAVRTAIALLVWLVIAFLTLVYLQGRWGVTPGKWCCGLRIRRATLKPCGFARSLARELALAFDSCNLLCWGPGIVGIALTDHRQRLGDLVADTVVIQARPLRELTNPEEVADQTSSQRPS